nr:MAG TPA: hypothetical protein [Caudoviricetes sp.]
MMATAKEAKAMARVIQRSRLAIACSFAWR